jgi:hypothetical protein
MTTTTAIKTGRRELLLVAGDLSETRGSDEDEGEALSRAIAGERAKSLARGEVPEV